MSTNVIMPSMGFDMTEGKVARWLKNVGEAVERGETIGEIETEKATVDLSAPTGGVLAQIIVQPGETVPVNTTIAVIAAEGESVGAPVAAPSPAPAAAPTADAEIAQEEAPASAQVTPDAAVVPTTTTAPSAAAPAAEEGRIKASPVARNMAKAAGIALTSLKGSGPGGRIIERDVQAAIDGQQQGAPKAAAAKPAVSPAPAAAPKTAAAPAPAAKTAAAAAPQPAATAVGGEQVLSKMRQTIATRMTQSKTTAPHFYLTIEINMTDAMKMREQLNALASDAEKVSVNDLIISAAAHTLRKFPMLNASFRGDKLELHNDINIGVAVAIDEGLLTPVLHNADQKSIKQIAAEARAMAERTRNGRMKPEDLGPGTFTISNLGMFGIDEFIAIINPPEAAILAVGAVKKTPVVINDVVMVAQTMKATISVDHRVADGAQGARFMQELRKLLENPVNLLLS